MSKELKSLLSSQSTASAELWEARITGSTPQSSKQPEDGHSSSVKNKPDHSKQNQTNTTLNESSQRDLIQNESVEIQADLVQAPTG